MNQFMQWLAMGGYSIYVWSAYGLVAAVFLVKLLDVKCQAVRTRKKLRDWFKRQSV